MGVIEGSSSGGMVREVRLRLLPCSFGADMAGVLVRDIFEDMGSVIGSDMGRGDNGLDISGYIGRDIHWAVTVCGL